MLIFFYKILFKIIYVFASLCITVTDYANYRVCVAVGGFFQKNFTINYIFS